VARFFLGKACTTLNIVYILLTNVFIQQFDGMDAYERMNWMWNTCRETYEKAKQGVQTNYYGTKRVTETLLPLLQSSSDGRIINVSSNFGLLRVSIIHHPLQQVPPKKKRT
jgi:(+)-neomenthol dehydrogenase